MLQKRTLVSNKLQRMKRKNLVFFKACFIYHNLTIFITIIILKVGKVFSNVASRYDVMNDLMSATLHRSWKATLINQLNPPKQVRHLDVAGGSGDIAFRLLDHIRANHGTLDYAKCTVLDINANMLGVGRVRAESRGYPDG